jgi:sugar/nucleoside kinase (ribokinase family)
VLLFDGHELSASLDAISQFPEARTILDGGSVRCGTLELAQRVDHLVVSEKFARQFSGQPDLATDERQEAAVRALFEMNGHPVVVTLGERGLLYGTDSHVQRMGAFGVESVDTTAAGDLFHGAFAYGILKGMPMEATLRLASAAAALATTRRGGRTSIPTLAEVETLLGRAN